MFSINSYIKKHKKFLIAEIGNNHEGNLAVAKKLIHKANKSGASAVKFQTFKTDNYINFKEKKIIKKLKKFELTQKEFSELKKIAKKKKLKFISTPFDLDSCDFLLKIVDIIKISSGDNNFYQLIDKVLKSNKNVIISLGLLDDQEIEYLIKYIWKKIGKKKTNKKVFFLHCVSSYPVPEEHADLSKIETLRSKYRVNVGYSDHTIGIDACIYSYLLGAKIIEKHFTIDKNFSSFRDHKLSATEKEMLILNSKIDQINLMKKKSNVQFKKRNYSKMRRSPYAKKDLTKGNKLEEKDIIFQRPFAQGTTTQLHKMLDKVLKKNIKKFNIINLNNLK